MNDMRREDGLDREEVPMLPVLLCCAAVIGFVSALVYGLWGML